MGLNGRISWPKWICRLLCVNKATTVMALKRGRRRSPMPCKAFWAKLSPGIRRTWSDTAKPSLVRPVMADIA